MLFFRETHSSRHGSDSEKKVEWTECGFTCTRCRQKYKSFHCESDNCENDNVVIAVPLITAYLPSHEGCCLKFGVCLLAFFFSLGGTGNLLHATRMSEDAALVVSYVVAIAVTVFAAKAVKAKRWLSYDQ